MSESIIADFVGKFNAEVLTRAEPVKGRVLLSQKRLVLAAREDDKLTIPLSSIFDIAVGHIPPDLGDFFDSTVTVAFERGNSRHVAVVEADDDKISKFSTVLFKAILNGTETTVKERARVGGRVTSEEYTTAKLFLKPGTVEFRKPDGSFEVSLKTVTDFQRSTREIAGSNRPALNFRHMKDGTADHHRGRHGLAAEDGHPRPVPPPGVQRPHAGDQGRRTHLGQDGDPRRHVLDGRPRRDAAANIVSAEASEVTMLLQDLEEDGLLQDSADGPTLTPTGEVVASRHLEDVND